MVMIHVRSLTRLGWRCARPIVARLGPGAARAWFLVTLLVSATNRIGAQQSGPDSVRVLLARADSAWRRGSHELAWSTYRQVASLDSLAVEPVAVRLARLEAQHNRLDPGIALLQRRTLRQPDDREARQELARMLSWRGLYDAALVEYGILLQSDTLDREATLGHAQVLTWAGRYDRALEAYATWLARFPSDTAAHLAKAQALAWAGRLDDAQQGYSVAAQMGSREGARGVARTIAWKGELTRSRDMWRALLRSDSADVEAWMGLAEVQQWAGEVRPALHSLQRAVAINPGHRDASNRLSQARVDVAGATEPGYTRASDSDGNQIATLSVGFLSADLGRVRVRVTGTRREAWLGPALGRSNAGRAAVSWASAEGRWSSNAELGAAQLTSRDLTRRSTLPIAMVRISGTPRRGINAGATASLAPFDETAGLIARGLAIHSLDADAGVTRGRLTIAGGVGRAEVARGSMANTRHAGSATIRWSARPSLALGILTRAMAWDTTGRSDGYFAPSRFLLTEVSARWSPGRNTRFAGTAIDAGLGRQQIRFVPGQDLQSHRAARASTTVRFAPAPGYAIEVTGGVSSVASPFADGAGQYSYRWFALGGRVKVF